MILATHICHTCPSIPGNQLIIHLFQNLALGPYWTPNLLNMQRMLIVLIEQFIHSLTANFPAQSTHKACLSTSTLLGILTSWGARYSRNLLQLHRSLALVTTCETPYMRQGRLWSSAVTSSIHINFFTSKVTSFFWKLQSSIIAQLCCGHPQPWLPLGVSICQRPHCHGCILWHVLTQHWQFNCWFLCYHHRCPYVLY